MKIINKYILVAAASLSVVACSQDDGLSNSYLKDSDAVHITAQVGSNEATGGFISRSNPLGSEMLMMLLLQTSHYLLHTIA